MGNNSVKFPQVLTWKPGFIVVFNDQYPKGPETDIFMSENTREMEN
jgi:hypothetical protein